MALSLSFLLSVIKPIHHRSTGKSYCDAALSSSKIHITSWGAANSVAMPLGATTTPAQAHRVAVSRLPRVTRQQQVLPVPTTTAQQQCVVESECDQMCTSQLCLGFCGGKPPGDYPRPDDDTGK